MRRPVNRRRITGQRFWAGFHYPHKLSMAHLGEGAKSNKHVQKAVQRIKYKTPESRKSEGDKLAEQIQRSFALPQDVKSTKSSKQTNSSDPNVKFSHVHHVGEPKKVKKVKMTTSERMTAPKDIDNRAKKGWKSEEKFSRSDTAAFTVKVGKVEKNTKLKTGKDTSYRTVTHDAIPNKTSQVFDGAKRQRRVDLPLGKHVVSKTPHKEVLTLGRKTLYGYKAVTFYKDNKGNNNSSHPCITHHEHDGKTIRKSGDCSAGGEMRPHYSAIKKAIAEKDRARIKTEGISKSVNVEKSHVRGKSMDTEKTRGQYLKEQKARTKVNPDYKKNERARIANDERARIANDERARTAKGKAN